MNANQFGDTLRHIMESRYNMPFKEAMQMLADRGLTRNEVAEEVGCSHSTVTKYGWRLGIDFASPESFTGKKVIADKKILEDFKRQLKNSKITPMNVLSKKWCNFSI